MTLITVAFQLYRAKKKQNKNLIDDTIFQDLSKIDKQFR